jgi:predicted GTPase
VLIILDAGVKDFGTLTQLLKKTIAPNIETNRVLIALNKVDNISRSGKYQWDYEKNTPSKELDHYLKSKINSIQERLYQSLSLEFDKITYFSAAYNYRIPQLLDLIIDNIPERRRI